MNRVRRYQTNRKRSEAVKEKYPVLIGHSVKACKKLYDIGEVADFICEYGVYGEVSVETPSGALLLTTYGIYLDRVTDLEYREKLLEVLVPKQQALEKAGQISRLQKNFNDEIGRDDKREGQKAISLFLVSGQGKSFDFIFHLSPLL